MTSNKHIDSELEYSKNSFENIADNYDQIPFFKQSAIHMFKLVEKLHCDITQAQNILDIACGTGNVVIEFATALPYIQFDAMDLSSNMLNKARNKAMSLNLTNISFQECDISAIDYQKKYDVITCAYALFFLPEAHKALKKLQQQLTQNGILVFSSFQAQAFQPCSKILLKLLRHYGSPSAIAFQENRWQNLMHTSDIEYLCKLANVELKAIYQEPINYAMNIDEWWFLFNNTGYRGMLLELSSDNLNKLKQDFYRELLVLETAEKNLIDLNADSFFVIVN